MNDSYQLSLLTYNVDGLNPVNLSYRTHTILGLILSENADVVQLQEVVPETDALITRSLSNSGYTSLQKPAIHRNLCHYFTLTFVKTNKFTECILERVPYTGNATSQQGRDSLQLRFKYKGLSWLFINCHLESCGAAFKSPGSFIRQAQLTDGLLLLDSHREIGPAILAGDLNIRDPEANKVLQSFNGTILDVSLQLEKGKKTSTWYMPVPSKYHARYDRIYYNYINNFISKTFRVIGGEDIYPDLPAGFNEEETLPYRTASDHRGLVVVFEFTSTNNTTATTSSTTDIHTQTDIAKNSVGNNNKIITTTKSSSTTSNNGSTTTNMSNTTTHTNSDLNPLVSIDNPRKRRKFTPPVDADIIVLDDDPPGNMESVNKETIKGEDTTTNSSSSSSNSSNDFNSMDNKTKRRELLLLAAEKRQLSETKVTTSTL